MRDQTTSVEILRVDGSRETHEIGKSGQFVIRWVQRMIGADALNTVTLSWTQRRTPVRVMLVDDLGVLKGLPVNVEATKLYRERAPGSPNQIHGDVAIVDDRDMV